MPEDETQRAAFPPRRSTLEAGTTAQLIDDMSWRRRSGHDIDAIIDERGRTLLMESAQAGRAGFVRALIDQGAHVDRQDISGYTALLLARDFETAKVLIEAGAHSDASAHNGVTPLFVAAQHGELALARLLLTAGADADAITRHGTTAIMRAAENGHFTVVDALLDAGADPHRRDRWGRCALDYLPGIYHSNAA